MAGFTKVDGKDVGDIKLFALSTCGWCRKTKEFLGDSGVEYYYIDVDLLPDSELDEVLEQQLGYNPAGSFPTIVINGNDVVIGFDERRLRELVKS